MTCSNDPNKRKLILLIIVHQRWFDQSHTDVHIITVTDNGETTAATIRQNIKPFEHNLVCVLVFCIVNNMSSK